MVIPAGIASTGLPAAKATCALIGLGFDPWQSEVARCILAKSSNGLYAADTVVLSIPRQVGKTYLIGALVFADSIIHPGHTTVWTSHRFKVARETFNALRSTALSPALEPHIDPDAIYTAAGNESITFRNGSRIMFAARERGAIRGFSKIDRLVIDEAQILSEAAMSDLAPTQNQAANPQMILMGTPPKPTDQGETFAGLRADALGSTPEGLVYVEFSADPAGDIDDRAMWRQANPSYPKRTPARAIQRMRKLLANDADFRREALGIWDAAHSMRVIPAASWDAAGDVSSVAVDRKALGIEVGPDMAWASVCLAGQRSDGLWHVELNARDDGATWVVPHVVGLLERNPEIRAVVLDAASPGAALRDEFERAGVLVTWPKVRELGAACSRMLDGIVTRDVIHTRQPQLAVAVSIAGRRKLADTGMWLWSRASATSDITPIQAATLALFGAQSDAVATAKKPSMSYAF